MPNSLAYSYSQSQETPESCPPKMAVFRCFFGRKKVFLAKRSTFTYSMSYIFWKLLFQPLILAISEDFLSILRGVRILVAHWNRIEPEIWHLVLLASILTSGPNWSLVFLSRDRKFLRPRLQSSTCRIVQELGNRSSPISNPMIVQFKTIFFYISLSQ